RGIVPPLDPAQPVRAPRRAGRPMDRQGKDRVMSAEASYSAVVQGDAVDAIRDGVLEAIVDGLKRHGRDPMNHGIVGVALRDVIADLTKTLHPAFGLGLTR